MRPQMPQTVTLRTPASLVVDPVSGNERPLPAIAESSPAYLAQKPVDESSTITELAAGQDTVIGLWTLLVPPEITLTSRTEVIDSRGRVFRVVGDPAGRPEHQPQFRAAAVRLISDLQ